MPDYQFKLTGWKAVAAGVILVGLFAVRLMTFNDQKNNEALIQKLNVQLVSDYFPGEVESLKSAIESGNLDEVSNVAKSVTTAKLNIESVQTSSALFEFSSNKKVIVKVTYSLDDDNGNRNKKTNYYYFRYGLIGDTWDYRYESNALMYYLNFV